MDEKIIPEIIENGEQIDRAMRQAVQNALREHKRRGQYIVVWRDGKIVRVPPEEISVPEEETSPEPVKTPT
jgi:hypothetical protein